MREYDYTVFIDLAKWFERKCDKLGNGDSFGYMIYDLKKHRFTQDEIEELHITSNNFDGILDPCEDKIWTKFNAYVISVFEEYNTYDEMVESLEKLLEEDIEKETMPLTMDGDTKPELLALTFEQSKELD